MLVALTALMIAAPVRATDPAWSALGTGMNNNAVFALVTDSAGNLYAGGSFTTAGGTSANYVAKWNGTSWSALGTGMNTWVTALATDSAGNLYAGGLFTTAGGAPANRVAKWDGLGVSPSPTCSWPRRACGCGSATGAPDPWVATVLPPTVASRSAPRIPAPRGSPPACHNRTRSIRVRRSRV